MSYADNTPVQPNPIHVAFVIDDGPVEGKSDAYIKLFREKNVVATFSFVASVLEKDPGDGRAILAAGHEVANHSFDHRHPAELGEEQLEQEVWDAQQIMKRILGTGPRIYWPPYVETTEALLQVVRKHGLGLIPFRNFIGTRDWDRSVGGEQIYKLATTNITDGTLINFHEWREETLQQMPAIIDELRRQGCVFLRASEMADYLSGSPAR